GGRAKRRPGDRHARALRHRRRHRGGRRDGAVQPALAGGAVAAGERGGEARGEAASPVPLCAGENLYLRWGFRDLLEQQAVDYIMPDIPKCGGLSECRKIANMAEVYFIPLAPHNVCGPLGTTASAHVFVSIRNFLVMEWHWVDYHGWEDLTIQGQ